MSKKRRFFELLEAAIDSHPEWPTGKPQKIMFAGTVDPEEFVDFPWTEVPASVLKSCFAEAFGREAGKGFNGKGDIEQTLAGVHDGPGKIHRGATSLKVYREGLLFYLTTRRDPFWHWSSSVDRNGNDVNAEWRKKQTLKVKVD